MSGDITSSSRATLDEVSAEMMTAQKLMIESQPDARALYALPLALFLLPAMSAIGVFKHGPKGLFLAPLMVCMAAAVYAVMGYGLLQLARRQRLRESQSVDLNQKAAAPDGTIVDTGKYEAWVRRLAAFGALHVGAYGILLLTRVPAAIRQGGWQILMLSMFLLLAWRGVSSLVSRARGRSEKVGEDWHRNAAWSTWSLIVLLVGSVDRWFGPHFPGWLLVLYFAQLVPPALAWWLDRAGRRKARPN